MIYSYGTPNFSQRVQAQDLVFLIINEHFKIFHLESRIHLNCHSVLDTESQRYAIISSILKLFLLFYKLNH
jgi:hypothetical protein